MRTRVKICCIQSAEEAAMAVAAGADALGLVGPMPSGPGIISLAQAAEIARRIPPPVTSVLLSCETRIAPLAAAIEEVRPGAVQLVARTEAAVRRALRERFAGLRILQVVHVTDHRSLEEAEEARRFTDALLLDSGRPTADPPRLGGTGETHDWALARRIRACIDRPVFLAGGPHAGNVVQAIAAVAPFAVDVCSGVRRDGRLDGGRVSAFLSAVGAAVPT